MQALGRRAVAVLDRRERHGERAPGRGKAAGAWALSRVRLLETVPEGELMALEPAAEVRSLARRRSTLLDESDGRVWVVLEGGAKLCRVGLAGKRLVEAILEPGDLFGRISAGADSASYQVEGLEPTRFAGFARAGFELLLRRAGRGIAPDGEPGARRARTPPVCAANGPRAVRAAPRSAGAAGGRRRRSVH